MATVVLGLVWLAGCFAAAEARWWNSLWLFVGVFSLALALGLGGRKSVMGIVGLCGSGLCLALTLFFVFSQP